MIKLELDTRNMLGSIDMLSEQIRHAWANTQTLQLPDSYQQCKAVVLFGMGGSALGMDIIRTVFADQARVPLCVVNDYHIPAWVNKETLVILSSYSGTTEETVAVAKRIAEITPNIVVMTTGGELKRLMAEHHWPGYIIEPTYNPCEQPRIAVGYAVVGLMRLLSVTGMITVTDQDVDNIIHYLDGNRELLRDAAQELAAKLAGHMPMYVGSEFLLGNLHVVTNQTNENGKNFASWFAIPELNHHLMEGLGFPESTKQLHFVFVESQLYYERTMKRYDVTRQILDKQHIQHDTFLPTAATPLLQAFEVLQWGGYVSFYLALHNGVDPSPIPWVDFFKNALKR